jgi:CBS domain-containing protein
VTSSGKTAEADAACIGEGETLRQAGHRMRELGVGRLAVRRENGELQGVISRDMVVESIAAGGDPKTVTVGEVVSCPPAPAMTPAKTRPGLPRRAPAAVSLPSEITQYVLRAS